MCCVTLESYCTSLCLKVFLCNMRTALNTTCVLWRFEELIHIKHLEKFPARNELSEPVSNYCYYCLQTVGSMLCLVTQSCLTLCDPMDCSPPGSSVHEILQARILEWVAMPSSRGSSQPRDRTQVLEQGKRKAAVNDEVPPSSAVFCDNKEILFLLIFKDLAKGFKVAWETHVPQCSLQHCLQ